LSDHTNPQTKGLSRIERGARALFVGASVVTVPAVTGLITADALLRYLASAPLIWAQDVAGLLLLVLFCACFPYSWHGKFHVRLDLVYAVFPHKVRKVVDSLTVITAFAFGGFLAYQCFSSSFVTYRTEATMPSVAVPIWPFVLAAAVAFSGFCLLMIVTLTGTWFRKKSK